MFNVTPVKMTERTAIDSDASHVIRVISGA